MMQNWAERHPWLISGLLLGAGSTGTLIYHRHALNRALQAWRIQRIITTSKCVPHIINTTEAWEKVAPQLIREVNELGAVGFDCEWVSTKGQRRPVALMQLASCNGTCVLVRLSSIEKPLPSSLKELLADDTLLKFGVGIIDDRKHLANDHNLEVNGCIDVRHLAMLYYSMNLSCESTANKKLGLSALAKEFLGKKLDKDWRVRASDWEAEPLTKRQINYAAEDALVGVHIIVKLLSHLWSSSDLSLPFLTHVPWLRLCREAIYDLCLSHKDNNFRDSKKNKDASSASGNSASSSNPKKPWLQNHTRNKDLYINCQLLAPDGEMLSFCDDRKAMWYVRKGIGTLVSSNPLVIQLHFEPAGRPIHQGEDGEFYTKVRLNICVVCGKDDSIIKKHVVPQQYRQYFPIVAKAHLNHDILLMCTECHRISHVIDNNLIAQLAEEFDAPTGTQLEVMVQIDSSLKAVRNAAGALFRCRDKLPKDKRNEFEQILKDYFELDELDEETIRKAGKLDFKINNSKFMPHGEKVVEAYKKIGLIKMEQRWRENFLSSMNPQHLPEGWSIKHNETKMRLKMSYLPYDHPDRENYKISLVGTEGIIDIPFVPKLSREVTPTSDNVSPSTSKESSPDC